MKKYKVNFDVTFSKSIDIEVESESVTGVEELALEQLKKEWSEFAQVNPDCGFTINKCNGVKSELDKGE
jgi:hypothetical protein